MFLAGHTFHWRSPEHFHPTAHARDAAGKSPFLRLSIGSLCTLLFVMAAGSCHADPPGGNRLAYLQECDPYYVGLKFPKLTTGTATRWLGSQPQE